MESTKENTAKSAPVRLPYELTARIRELAQKEARTAPQMATVLLKEALQARGIEF